VTGDEINYNMT